MYNLISLICFSSVALQLEKQDCTRLHIFNISFYKIAILISLSKYCVLRYVFTINERYLTNRWFVIWHIKVNKIFSTCQLQKKTKTNTILILNSNINFSLQNTTLHKDNRLYHQYCKLSSITMSRFVRRWLEGKFQPADQYSVSHHRKGYLKSSSEPRERDYRCLYALHISIAINVIAKSSSSCFEEVERGYFASGRVTYPDMK